MPTFDNIFLAPGPGFPALLEDSDSDLYLYLHSPLRDEDLRAWTATLHLASPGSAHPAATLDLRSLERLSRDDTPTELRPALACVDRSGTPIRLTLRLRFAEVPVARSRYALFDLRSGDTTCRSRCVAVRTRADRHLSLAFASDLHVAAIWDSIDAALQRYIPELHGDFLHPGRLLQQFVTRATRLADAGELDLIVLGGDLVDHVLPGPHASVSGSNVHHLVSLLAELPVPTFVIPGNHDFRVYPWRPRIYPFASAGLPARRVAEALRRAGLWDSQPWRLSDLRCLRTTDDRGRYGLADHLLELAPTGDYVRELGDISLAFLSTGRDVLPRWRSVEPGRRRVMLRALPGSWEHPDSEGLSLQQLALAATAMRRGKGAALFFHAPLFNPPPATKIEDRLPVLHAPSQSASFGKYERRLARSGLRQGVFFRNPGALVEEFGEATGETTVFSGHVHQPHAAAYDPHRGGLRSVGFPLRPDGFARVHLLNAPASGQTAMQHGQAPGYLTARFEDGVLVEAERHRLGAYLSD